MQNFSRSYCVLKAELVLVFYLIFNLISFSSIAQTCPPNIDFEKGSFDGWTCYTGRTAAEGNSNVITFTSVGGPSPNNHTLYSNSREVDPYGGFPVSCPNGSGNSIKLGNAMGGGQAEGVSYEFTIPANQNSFALTYHYAVVFQAPNHRDIEQPRMEIEIRNITDNKIIDCASFTFISVGTALPGFIATSGINDTTTVMYKPWTAVSVDLSGNAGKSIRIFFKTADCTFQRHFGYAYIDVDSHCDGSFTGATFCPDDTAINIVAPFGYESYKWYNKSLTTLLGTDQTLTLTPPPTSGTTFAVTLQPYPGFGCPQTLYTTVRDSLTVISDAGLDAFSCNKDPVQIGTRPKPGLSYLWTPPIGLTNPFAANPFANPNVTTTYVVSTSNSGGGCRTTDTVVVRASDIKNDMSLVGKPAYCLGHGDSSILYVLPTDSIQWYKDNSAIIGANKTSLKVNQSGVYYAMLYNGEECIVTTEKQTIIIDKARPAEVYPVQYALINTPVTLKARNFGQEYLWSPGINLNTRTIANPVFTGAQDRLYTIQIKTNSGCVTVDTQLVKAIDKVDVFVPTGFTPNQDGRNDYLHPIMLGIKQLRYFRVFNRWGNLLYDMRGEQRGWDGTSNGIPQQTQTVVWMFEGVGIDNKVYIKKGSSVLLR